MADKEVLSEGFTQIPNKLIKYKDLDCIEKMILINFMSYGENIYPSISRICEELNISRPTCVKKIKALKDNGYLKVTKNKSLNGDYDNNSYEVVKNINHLVKEFNYGSKNNLPQVVKEINSNNTNKTILNNNIYSSLENELDTKEIEKDLIKKINSKYSKELIKEELEKLKDKDISKLDLLKELDKNLKSKSKDNSNQDISTIFDYWNSKGIIKHKELKEDTKKAIKKAIKNYSINEIKQAIDTYSEILKSEYYFNYKWNLKDFLNRNNAISTFMEDGSNKANYEEWKNKNKPKEEPKLKNNISNFDY
ncbi:helix-turn-helix domain-containing protein [Clostridium perfringens]|uniref:helix-turn-helix domain-containing protein n=1 Tax=Clostridium perfringens TaxID=1502 RepID=UPI00311A9DF9